MLLRSQPAHKGCGTHWSVLNKDADGMFTHKTKQLQNTLLTEQYCALDVSIAVDTQNGLAGSGSACLDVWESCRSMSVPDNSISTPNCNGHTNNRPHCRDSRMCQDLPPEDQHHRLLQEQHWTTCKKLCAMVYNVMSAMHYNRLGDHAGYLHTICTDRGGLQLLTYRVRCGHWKLQKGS